MFKINWRFYTKLLQKNPVLVEFKNISYLVLLNWYLIHLIVDLIPSTKNENSEYIIWENYENLRYK